MLGWTLIDWGSQSYHRPPLLLLLQSKWHHVRSPFGWSVVQVCPCPALWFQFITNSHNLYTTSWVFRFVFPIWLELWATLLSTAPHGFRWYCYIWSLAARFQSMCKNRQVMNGEWKKKTDEQNLFQQSIKVSDKMTKTKQEDKYKNGRLGRFLPNKREVYCSSTAGHL